MVSQEIVFYGNENTVLRWARCDAVFFFQAWLNFFFEILSDLNQAVHYHLADKSQTR